MGDGLSIEMLPARHGDALWIEWGSERRHRMLIDGGPNATYDELHARFSALETDHRHVDLLVVTHIDLDHIDGAIRLLHDRSLGVSYGDIWFNDHRHLTDGSNTRGAIQGEYLAALLDDPGLPWNGAFDGGAVVVPPTGPLPSITLDGGLRLVLLSPTPERLHDLDEKWEKTLEKAGLEPGDREEALARLEGRLGPIERGRAAFGGDRSAANGSSIAFIAEYRAERWLLAGDAHVDVLLTGLQRYAGQVGEQRLRLDGFKLPHHGSVANITPELLDAIECRQFLISTNGAYFGHPDEACLDLVVRHSDRPELVFNYRTEQTETWADSSPDYHAVYLDEPVDAQRFTGEAAAVPERPTDSHDDAAHDIERATVEVVPVIAPPTAEPSNSHEPHVTAEPADGDVITVTVCHGSLELAGHPVLVGHYAGTSMSGTEGFIDRRFHGRLSDRMERGTYPGAIGTSVLVAAPTRRHPASGVLVVGLGEYGELTPLRLVESVRLALVRLALDGLDRADGASPSDMGIATVLLGATGDQGLSVGASVRAIVTAVVEANRTLSTDDGPRKARYREVQFWERYETHAELAFRSVTKMADDATPGPDPSALEGIAAAPELHVVAGALENIPLVEGEDGVWWRVRISGRTDDTNDPSYLELDFSVGGRLARTGHVAHRVERRRLERLLRSAVANTTADSGIQTTLFELLFPNQLKWELMAAQDIQLEVDELTADIPWEMLSARNPQDTMRGQLALRAPIVRQLQVPDIPTVRRSSQPNALVIGNPPAGRQFPPLPGAYGEARTVASVLQRAEVPYSVTSLCFDEQQVAEADTPRRIETALFERDYRIVHIAAHGVFQPDDPTRTGVVIGPDDFLTAQVFRQLNVVPDMVFLNCCHLGNVASGIESGALQFTRARLNQLGASLARQLIDSGVRAVVVAGWAVHDGAAVSFARTFYEQMLEGRSFGWAVFDARKAAWITARTHTTWGAYQCYGDAGYRFPTDAAKRRTRKSPAPLTVREAIRRLQALISRIEFVGVEADVGPERSRAMEELTVIERAASDRSWTAEGGPASPLKQQLREHLAEAGAALGDHERAIAWFSAGLAASDSTVTLRSIERLANHQDRLASALNRRPDASDADRARSEGLLAAAAKSIGLLEALSPSSDSSALRAGHHKRRAAAATTGDERAEELRLAADAYLRTYEQNEQPYGLLNHIQLEEIRSRIRGEQSRARMYTASVDEIIAAGATSTCVDYWSAVGPADAVLTRAIIDDAVAARAGQLVQMYTDAFDSRSTGAQRATTLDHLLDLAEVHPDAHQAEALFDVHARLEAPTPE